MNGCGNCGPEKGGHVLSKGRCMINGYGALSGSSDFNRCACPKYQAEPTVNTLAVGETIYHDDVTPVTPEEFIRATDSQPAALPDPRVEAVARAAWPWYTPGYVQALAPKGWNYFDRAAAAVAALDAYDEDHVDLAAYVDWKRTEAALRERIAVDILDGCGDEWEAFSIATAERAADIARGSKIGSGVAAPTVADPRELVASRSPDAAGTPAPEPRSARGTLNSEGFISSSGRPVPMTDPTCPMHGTDPVCTCRQWQRENGYLS